MNRVTVCLTFYRSTRKKYTPQNRLRFDENTFSINYNSTRLHKMDILKADNNKQNMIVMTILIRMFLQTHFLLYWVKWKQQKYSSSSFFCECATSTTNSYSTRMTCFLSLVLKASIQYLQKQDLNLDFISSNVCSLIFYICIQT